MVIVECSWHRWLLRARCKRPWDRRAAEKGDEVAPFHADMGLSHPRAVDLRT
jgi:hypothetical protein